MKNIWIKVATDAIKPKTFELWDSEESVPQSFPEAGSLRGKAWSYSQSMIIFFKPVLGCCGCFAILQTEEEFEIAEEWVENTHG